jgi:hypothetical protein
MLAVVAVITAPVSFLTTAKLVYPGRHLGAHGKLCSFPIRTCSTQGSGIAFLGMIQDGLMWEGPCSLPHRISQTRLVPSRSHLTDLETSSTSVYKNKTL